ncbi:MAG: Cof-type HAD-IIB family hydrolase [Clostridiales bacterium]|jgi:Cof subfamily protein (haloacid dehalogenase superfamily)|nr:Cof-type HAD-IIB family hydrolase [Clostridiales bacterium]
MALLDIDGTTVTPLKSVTRKTKQVIHRMIDNGIIVCICTGRNVASTLPVAKSLGLTTPCMCIDGMIMYDPPQKKVIYESKLPNTVMRDVLSIVHRYNVNIEVITNKYYYWYLHSKEIRGYDFYTQNSNSLAIRLGSLFYKYMFGVRNIANLDRFFTDNDQIYEIVAIGDPSQTDSIKKDLSDHSNKDILTRMLWQNQLFITAKDVGKSHGLRILCEHFNISSDEVVAIGDDDNDIDMLKMAGVGVAMGNASDEVKACADYVTLSNNEDGAAVALEELFL